MNTIQWGWLEGDQVNMGFNQAINQVWKAPLEYEIFFYTKKKKSGPI